MSKAIFALQGYFLTCKIQGNKKNIKPLLGDGLNMQAFTENWAFSRIHFLTTIVVRRTC